MSPLKLSIAGWTACPFYSRCVRILEGIAELSPSQLTIEKHEQGSRDEFRSFWFEKRKSLGPRAEAHSSSPAVWMNDNDFLGGFDETQEFIRENFMTGASIARPPRVTHENDTEDKDVQMQNGNLRGSEQEEAPEGGYDFDLVVIGGGSGGLAAGKKAADLGAKVACLDYVKPSPHGTKWGLGGTCVNVGCIPKKLMHQAAQLGDYMEDARQFGWQFGETKFDWGTFVEKIQEYIKSINFGYKAALRTKKVTYKNALGRFVDPHTIETTDKRGKKETFTTRRVIVAVGGRPNQLDVPGGEYAITSDDLFSLSEPPGKTLVVGASYVALECAGFLTAYGYDTTVMVRSILLRGFDQQCAEIIGENMQHHGTHFIRKAVPKEITKQDDGKLKVTYVMKDDNSEYSDVFDTVLAATGRYADTKGLDLQNAGVQVAKNGKIPVQNEQSNVPHIYAIGDIVENGLELTPVAIQAGELLSERLFNNKTEGMDYNRVPTTVFTPLEYGACGYPEEQAIEEFGEDNIEVYHTNFKPLEWELNHDRPDNACYTKLVVNKADDERVVGFHYLGPNAGEVTQGVGVAIRLGATYHSFLRTVGIHPTCAENFTTLSVSKSSGKDATKTGC
eukprot:gb/GECG01013139.1/.p1 GENE.gb/GECG01013139.1/~~gb/GECG01013139.1/.p1  ORF type:complete len:618 (+),score=95.37 gb/GECG01013139.1/:1-1854(+)